MFKMENGDLKIVNNDLQVISEKARILQEIEEKIKLIKGTYNLREELGIPWMEYNGKLNSTERDNIIITFMYEKVSGYKGIDVSSIFIEKVKKENREASFNIEFVYLGEKVNQEIEGGAFNGI
ncbi:hypothetical protein EII29_08335 [Leptotrichia sp. OH3620_COT-345]|uniref:hypothetical protein n=1 Tax=Leptotrichia sp. OH3620_COT-345 TaxID=2491048 RepID=UPI000F64EF61|nr:hypothetical protein [Leptotrichia sp. OH3620_COT-345]RRD39113.1 hypothetical protein EII29_08335 [Leptotrichia sp. OH3620_COT-345]